MRKICFSCTNRVSSLFSLSALGRSVPKGFSTTTRCHSPGVSSRLSKFAWQSCSTTAANWLGEMAR